MKTTIKRLKRDYCIIKFRKLPLHYIEKKSGDEHVYYPEIASWYWITLSQKTKIDKENEHLLITEICQMMALLGFDHLIFLGAINKPWISTFTANRRDSKSVLKTLQYFKKNKIGRQYNGGVQIEHNFYNKFLKHYYRLTRYDAGFSDYHFCDENENIIFYIHYSGEVKVMILNEKYIEKFNQCLDQLNLSFSTRYITS